MKSFDDFKKTLTPEVKEQLFNDSVSKISPERISDSGTMLFSISAEYNLAILELYHHWLNN